MPDSKLNIIGESAFFLCKISTILIPKSVTKICKRAFSMCNDLKQICFEENSNLRVIEFLAFRSTNLEKISIPPKVEIIDLNAFADCNKLKTIIFNKDIDLNLIKFEKCNADLLINKSPSVNSSLISKPEVTNQCFLLKLIIKCSSFDFEAFL